MTGRNGRDSVTEKSVGTKKSFAHNVCLVMGGRGASHRKGGWLALGLAGWVRWFDA